MVIDIEMKSNWEEFARLTKGKFHYDETVFAGGDRFKCQIEYIIDDFTIYFISYRHRTANFSPLKKNTKVFIPLKNDIGFRFSIYPETIASKVLKVVGLQDIIIGMPELDNKFIFKGNNKRVLQNIFGDRRIAGILLKEYAYNLCIKSGKRLSETELPENKSFLIFESDQLIKEPQQLEYLLELFKAVMNKMKKEIDIEFL